MITRFAPSPTGPLHLGHAYSALLAYDMVKMQGGTFLLRIEDIDQSRSRAHWVTQIYEDLEWLGVRWEHPVMHQSSQRDRYSDVLNQMWWDGLLYACSCNRRDIQEAVSAPQEGGVKHGPDGIIYPGTCRNQMSERDHYPASPPRDKALRLDWSTFPKGALDGLVFSEHGHHTVREVSVDLTYLTEHVGDVVLARREMGTSYHLSVVLDDAAQGVTDVVRGEDLFDATYIHVALQSALGLPTPRYHHHRLIRDEHGKRLAKRDDAKSISKYRAEGATADDIRQMIGLPRP